MNTRYLLKLLSTLQLKYRHKNFHQIFEYFVSRVSLLSVKCYMLLSRVNNSYYPNIINFCYYCMEGNFDGGNVGEFGESSVIHQTKTIQVSTYN